MARDPIESLQARPRPGALRNVYDLVTGDEEARVCRDISEDACREQPANFFIHLLALIATKTGDLIASPKLVLPWLFSLLGVPVWMTGLLVPIRESLALLPQLAIAGWMRAQPIRKGFWIAGSAAQGLAVALMITAAWQFDGATAGALILAALVCFAIGRGFCSTAYKDVKGKTIAKNRRGTLSGYAASAAGGLAMLFGTALWLWPDVGRSLTPVLTLLGVAALAWLAAAAIFALLREQPGATEGGGNALKTAFASLSLLRDKPAFARFVAVRGLLIATALAAPYYTALAHDAGAGALSGLAVLLLLSGLASLVSAPIWGRFSDRSARQVLMITGVAAAGLNLAVAGVARVDWADALGVWPFAIGYCLLAGLHAGVRIGRKTYLTDLGNADDRARLTAVANTAIGVILLGGGGLIALIGQFGPAAAVAALALPALLAAGLARGLPELER